MVEIEIHRRLLRFYKQIYVVFWVALALLCLGRYLLVITQFFYDIICQQKNYW